MPVPILYRWKANSDPDLIVFLIILRFLAKLVNPLVEFIYLLSHIRTYGRIIFRYLDYCLHIGTTFSWVIVN